MASLIRLHPRCVLGLATGSSPIRIYQSLVALHRGGNLSFRDVRTFNLDEYIGLPPGDENSYRTFMDAHLFSKIDITPEQTQLPNSHAADLNVECLEYEEKLRLSGGVDLQLLGIGRNGHIGFNEPGASLASRTRVVTLAQVTREDNARFFGRIEQVPRTAITMGVGTILESRQILLIAIGSNKAEIVRQAIEGPVTSMVPASALQFHPDVTVMLDEAAASKLEYRSYYDDCEIESSHNNHLLAR